MKTLYLIRHAKAGWEHPELPDFERPLTEVGIRDAHAMGAQLKDKGVTIDYLLTSPAARALHTAQIIAAELNFAGDKIISNEQIYRSGVEELMECLKNLDGQFNHVVCVGHNPTLTWMFHYFCEQEKTSMPTCGVVGLQFPMHSWSHLPHANGKLILFAHPMHENL
jgi:phosphohistidine phosphatase